MNAWLLLRIGNIYRVTAVNCILVFGLLYLVDASLWAYLLGAVGVLLASGLTAWWIGQRYAPTLEQWRRVAELAQKEDFTTPIDPEVPYALKPLRSSLMEARGRLAGSLERAREEKALLLSMLDAMTGGVIAIDASGRILLANREALSLFGISATESPGRFRGEPLVQLARDPRLNELVDLVLSSGRAMRDETEILATRRQVELSVAPIMGDGQVRGVVAVVVDATVVRTLERVRQDFVTNVSHELKTPIAAIRGWSETLVSGLLVEPEDQQEAAATIYRQSQRLSELIDDLMVLARAESAGAVATTDVFEFVELYEEVDDALAELLSEREVSLVLKAAPGSEELQSNRRSLNYVLRNLVENGVKYSPKGSSVVVHTDVDEEGQFILEVQDFGAGIDKMHLPRIFERFYRVDAGRSRDIGGNGLGLSIVKNFVTALGGVVTVESRVGKGTTFTVVLPAPTEPVEN